MKLLVLFLVIFSFTPLVYSNDTESTIFSWATNKETISEISTKIKELWEDQVQESDNKKIFLETYRFNQYFKRNLSEEDKTTIRAIAEKYVISTRDLEEELTSLLNNIQQDNTISDENLEKIESTKTSILESKKELYKDLTPFVDIKKYEDYLEYISQEVRNDKKTKDISSKLVIQKIKLSEKVTTIEEKIEANHEKLNNDINLIIEARIEKKISEFVNHPKFMKLSDQAKTKVLDITLRKIKIRISNIENNSINTSSQLLTRKKDTYLLIAEKIQEIQNQYKK